MCWELIAIFNLLKMRMRVDIFGTEKWKVTFGLKYITISSFYTQNEMYLARAIRLGVYLD